MPTKFQFQGGHYQGFKNDGTPNAGGTINFYEPGTTTDKDTYTTSDLTTANANPVVLDANGRATIWLNGNYKCVIKDSDGNTIRTEDLINPADASVTDTYNLIINPSFETDSDSDGIPDSWTLSSDTGSTNAIDTTDQQHGANSFKFISTGSGGGNLITDNFFEVSPSRDIEVLFEIKSSVADVRNLIEVVFYDSAQASVSTTSVYDESTANPTSWTNKGATITPPATARYAKLRLTGCHSSDATSGSTWYDNVIVRELPSYPTNHKSGLILSNDTDTDHDINITAGGARDSGDIYNLRLSSEITKQIDATWATGDDAGGLSSSLTAPANDTCYHVFLVEIAGAVDVLFDTSITCANGVTDHSVTKYRRIGSVRTDGSANIRAFVQDDIEFIYAVPVADVSADNPGTSAVTHTLTVATGVRVDAIITGYLDWATTGTALHRIFTTDETDAALSTANSSFRTRTALNTTPGFGRTRIKTDTSGQIKTRHDGSGVGDFLYINTVGWVDTALLQGN